MGVEVKVYEPGTVFQLRDSAYVLILHFSSFLFLVSVVFNDFISILKYRKLIMYSCFEWFLTFVQFNYLIISKYVIYIF
jgi:hypothetical protein